jgi:hypothetical protein
MILRLLHRFALRNDCGFYLIPFIFQPEITLLIASIARILMKSGDEAISCTKSDYK